MLCVLSAAVVATSVTGYAAIDSDHGAQVESARAGAKSLSLAFRHVAKQVQPSVVMIFNEPIIEHAKSTEPRVPDLGESPFGELFGRSPELRKYFEQDPRQYEPQRRGMGSGVIISAKGIILTNNHVVYGDGRIKVRLADGREFTATDVKTDPKTDLAVVRIEADGLQALRMGDSDRAEIGDWVLAVGQPFGLQGTVTAGIISAKDRGIGITARENFIQTDAAINPGNSGGPLVNLDGEIIGINTAISSSSGGNQGVGFAVPINLAKWVGRQLVSDGVVKRSYLGVGIQPITHQLAEQFGIQPGSGVLISEVRPGSPAAAAGMQTGDIVVELAGKRVGSPRQLQAAVEQTAPGVEQTIAVIRDKQRTTLKAKLQSQSETSDEQADQPAAEPSGYGQHGFEVETLTADIAERLGMKGAKGVVISAVEPGSAAERAGLKRGMVVAQVNRQAIASIAEFEKAVRAEDSQRGLLLLVRTAEGSRFVVVSPASQS
jgi:serine protease Do